MDEQGSSLKFQMIMQDEATLDRDRALVAFMQARISERAEVADKDEQRLLVGVHRVLQEFSANFERAERGDYFPGQIDALGWSLRCTAFAAFSEHPDFRMEFKP
ncbi:hypothetical protein EES39_38815 [Streptomyces sp. ADI92-24]|uniref:hypothetical protein n=1 Tax=Streptomyces sp. ADI92-24 TaxID=1522756 RepID=UPI000FAC1814|nr:hypothetical protein [Streptomyces sp. ADI92-24]RPK32443.1 hypothetical protein EES39_38815 [Streptomyces sp. ADI92-24]